MSERSLEIHKLFTSFVEHEAGKDDWAFLVGKGGDGWKLLYLSSEVAPLFKMVKKATEDANIQEVSLSEALQIYGLPHKDLESAVRAMRIVEKRYSDISSKNKK